MRLYVNIYWGLWNNLVNAGWGKLLCICIEGTCEIVGRLTRGGGVQVNRIPTLGAGKLA